METINFGKYIHHARMNGRIYYTTEDGDPMDLYDFTGKVIDAAGNEFYVVKSMLHRIDGPAVIYKQNTHRFGNIEYWVDGKLHNDRGAAKMENGERLYYIHGVAHTFEAWCKIQRERPHWSEIMGELLGGK